MNEARHQSGAERVDQKRALVRIDLSDPGASNIMNDMGATIAVTIVSRRLRRPVCACIVAMHGDEIYSQFYSPFQNRTSNDSHGDVSRCHNLT